MAALWPACPPGASRSTTTVRFDARTPGAGTSVDLVADRVRSATLNGTELDVSGWTSEHGLPLPDLAEQNELVVDADCRYSVSGEGLGIAESARGDIWHWLRLDGGMIAAAFAADPGWRLFPLAEQALADGGIGDADLILRSFDASASGVDL